MNLIIHEFKYDTVSLNILNSNEIINYFKLYFLEFREFIQTPNDIKIQVIKPDTSMNKSRSNSIIDVDFWNNLVGMPVPKQKIEPVDILIYDMKKSTYFNTSQNNKLANNHFKMDLDSKIIKDSKNN